MRNVSADVSSAAVDNFDNLYVISTSGQLKKYSAGGDSVAVYNQVRNFGAITSMDVSNPLKLLLFYKDFSTVVVLDRLLAARATLDLRKFAVYQPTAIGLSYDNNMWVFDAFDNRLKKFDEQGNKLLETTDLRNVFPDAITPSRITNDNGFVYLYDRTGIYVFDNYGTYKKRIPAEEPGSSTVFGDIVIKSAKDRLKFYNVKTFIERSISLPPLPAATRSFFTTNRFVTWNGDAVYIYSYKL